jgi:hypothetical protein
MKTSPQYNDNWIPFFALSFFSVFAIAEAFSVHFSSTDKWYILNSLGVLFLAILGPIPSIKVKSSGVVLFVSTLLIVVVVVIVLGVKTISTGDIGLFASIFSFSLVQHSVRFSF